MPDSEAYKAHMVIVWDLESGTEMAKFYQAEHWEFWMWNVIGRSAEAEVLLKQSFSGRER